MLRLKDWREVIFEDFPEIRITDRTRTTMRRAAESARYLINNVRIATGRFYTDSEYEARRSRILNTPLP